MCIRAWAVLVSSLFDWNGHRGIEVPGTDLSEWLALVHADYDDVDAILLDLETIGA